MLYTIHQEQEKKSGKFKRYKYVRAHQNENTTQKKKRVTQIFLYLLDFIKKKSYFFSLFFVLPNES